MQQISADYIERIDATAYTQHTFGMHRKPDKLSGDQNQEEKNHLAAKAHAASESKNNNEVNTTASYIINLYSFPFANSSPQYNQFIIIMDNFRNSKLGFRSNDLMQLPVHSVHFDFAFTNQIYAKSLFEFIYFSRFLLPFYYYRIQIRF